MRLTLLMLRGWMDWLLSKMFILWTLFHVSMEFKIVIQMPKLITMSQRSHHVFSKSHATPHPKLYILAPNSNLVHLRKNGFGGDIYARPHVKVMDTLLAF